MTSDLVTDFAQVLGVSPSDITLPTLANVVLSGVARQLADSGAVPSHGVVHTAENTQVNRPLQVGDTARTVLKIIDVRERGGVVQFKTEGTVSVDGQPVAIVTSTLTYREEQSQ